MTNATITPYQLEVATVMRHLLCIDDAAGMLYILQEVISSTKYLLKKRKVRNYCDYLYN